MQLIRAAVALPRFPYPFHSPVAEAIPSGAPQHVARACVLVLWVLDADGPNRELTVSFWQRGRIVNLANTILAAALPQAQARC